MKTDVLIIGSGIAGLSLAIKLNRLNPDLKIRVVTKADAFECNTRYAQGGIAAAMNTLNDSFEYHVQDTLNCGKGLCNREVVEMVVRQAPERIQELLELGVLFDNDENNTLNLGLEGGHSRHRIVHSKDKTGFEIEKVLLGHVRQCTQITLEDNTVVSDLATEEKNGSIRCNGVITYDVVSGKLETLLAQITVLASGGCGQVYMNTTNPGIASGDGYAIAKRAGAELKNMRFMQFHPTSLYLGINQPVSFLISEAVRGFGAYLVDADEKRFLFKYDERGELATRDVISAAIFKHLELTKKECVYLDLRHLDSKSVAMAFPLIYSELQLLKYNTEYDLIPVIPSAHYQCGGVAVNSCGKTSIANLYALGEVAHTGLHGANRLASNSLLEALVFSHNAANTITKQIDTTKQNMSPPYTQSSYVKPLSPKPINEHIFRIKKLMTKNAFSNAVEELAQTLNHIEEVMAIVEEEIQHKHYSEELLKLRNIAQTAQLITADRIEALQTDLNILNLEIKQL